MNVSSVSRGSNALANAVDVARTALNEAGETAVGEYLGVTAGDECSATHRFAATLPGYRGWQWAVVVAVAPESDHVTVSESALLPGPDALVAPEWLPWERRIRIGDLGPGDLLAPQADDDRLVPGYVANGDPEIDDLAYEVGLGRRRVLSAEGRAQAAQRWHDGEFGPNTEMARSAPSTCGLCGFYLPVAGALHSAFGVCANEYAADGRLVHTAYGCGAHSDTVLPGGGGSPMHEAYDDAAIEFVVRLEQAALDAPTETAPTEAEPPAPTDNPADAEATAPAENPADAEASSDVKAKP